MFRRLLGSGGLRKYALEEQHLTYDVTGSKASDPNNLPIFKINKALEIESYDA